MEEEMATWYSIFACEIPWTKEPGMLQSVHGVTKSQTQQLNNIILVIHTYRAYKYIDIDIYKYIVWI